MKKNIFIFLALAWSLLASSFIFAQKAPYLVQFKGITTLEFKIYHGDVNIVRHGSDEVSITGVSQSPKEMPVTETKGKTLIFLEHSQVDGSSPDWPVWTINVPQHINLKIEMGGGNLSIEGVTGTITGNVGAGNIKLHQIDGSLTVNAGTGNIDLTNSKGEFYGNTGTGNVKIDNVQGSFTLNTGTGNIKALNTIVTKKSNINSGTGNVMFGGKSAIQANLSLNTGTNNATIELEDLDFKGTLQLQCNNRGGYIQAPFSFDEEKEQRTGRDKSTIKSKKFGDADVLVTVATGLGTASAK